MNIVFAYIILYTIIFCFGMIVGSFLNVCIYRLPKEESLVKTSSHCIRCNEKIKRYDLIPIFSWLFLKGKCRNCGEKISARYPLVESLNAFSYLAVFAVFDPANMFLDWKAALNALILCVFFSMLIVIAFIDWDTKEMNLSILILIALLAVPSYFTDTHTLSDRLIGLVIVSVPLLIIGIFGGMGMGDVILMAGSGLLLGAKAVVVAAFIGILLGAVSGIIIKVITKNSQMPFGPALTAGLAIAALYGERIADWYIGIISATGQ